MTRALTKSLVSPNFSPSQQQSSYIQTNLTPALALGQPSSLDNMIETQSSILYSQAQKNYPAQACITNTLPKSHSQPSPISLTPDQINPMSSRPTRKASQTQSPANPSQDFKRLKTNPPFINTSGDILSYDTSLQCC